MFNKCNVCKSVLSLIVQTYYYLHTPLHSVSHSLSVRLNKKKIISKGLKTIGVTARTGSFDRFINILGMGYSGLPTTMDAQKTIAYGHILLCFKVYPYFERFPVVLMCIHFEVFTVFLNPRLRPPKTPDSTQAQ